MYTITGNGRLSGELQNQEEEQMVNDIIYSSFVIDCGSGNLVTR